MLMAKRKGGSRDATYVPNRRDVNYIADHVSDEDLKEDRIIRKLTEARRKQNQEA